MMECRGGGKWGFGVAHGFEGDDTLMVTIPGCFPIFDDRNLNSCVCLYYETSVTLGVLFSA